MSKDSPVTEEQCSDRISDVYGLLGKLNGAVSKIYGGIAVGSFVAVLIAMGVLYHFNFRFSAIEKTLAKVEKKL